MCFVLCILFFFKQKTAYEMRISDWSSDVCSSDLWSERESGLAARFRIGGAIARRIAFAAKLGPLEKAGAIVAKPPALDAKDDAPCLVLGAIRAAVDRPMLAAVLLAAAHGLAERPKHRADVAIGRAHV